MTAGNKPQNLRRSKSGHVFTVLVGAGSRFSFRGDYVFQTLEATPTLAVACEKSKDRRRYDNEEPPHRAIGSKPSITPTNPDNAPARHLDRAGTLYRPGNSKGVGSSIRAAASAGTSMAANSNYC